MDQLDVWAVQGRVATAITNIRKTLARLAVDSEELTEALAEAEQLGEVMANMEPITAGASKRCAHSTTRAEAVHP